MALEVRLLSESLIAQRAGERSDVLVHAHVHHEVVRLGEGFPADLAVFKDPVAGLTAGDYGAGHRLGRVAQLEVCVPRLVLRLGGGRVQVGQACVEVQVGVDRPDGVQVAEPFNVGCWELVQDLLAVLSLEHQHILEPLTVHQAGGVGHDPLEPLAGVDQV